MLEMKLGKESLFFNALEAMLDMFDVANIDCSEMGLKLEAVDTEHVAMITLFFPAEHFQHYNCDECLSTGIVISQLVQAVRGGADKDDVINLKIDDKNSNTITLSLESLKWNGRLNYHLPLLGPDSQRIQIPDRQDLESMYEASVQMPSMKFMRVCNCLNKIDHDAWITVTEEGSRFFASGKGQHLLYLMREETVFQEPLEEPLSLILDLKYLNSFAKMSILCDEVKIYVSTTKLLMVECKFGQMGYIRYFQASKIGEEEDNDEDRAEEK